MTPISDGNRKRAFAKIISCDLTVWALILILTITLVVELSIVAISGFLNPHDSTSDIPIFSGLGIFTIVSQLIILNFIRRKIAFIEKAILHTTFKALVVVQVVIVIILTIILIEINWTRLYHIDFLKLVFTLSSVTAFGIMSLLSLKFIVWLRYNKSWITFAYLLASSSLAFNALIGMIYVSDQLDYVSDVIHPTAYGGYLLHSGVGYTSLAGVYTISSGVTFVLFWLGTVLLLRSYQNRIGVIKYWIVMLVPLLYFLSQFQPLVTNALFDYSSGTPLLYGIVYVLMLEVSRPVGGILFGLAFVLVARKIQNSQVRSYLTISGFGLLLLLISYQTQDIITAPFPPFELLSASFIGLSSYLIYFGISSSAISVSLDSKLRASIRKSVEAEISFISNIASAEMTLESMEKVLRKIKSVSEVIPEETGIAHSLTDKEIKEYVDQVIHETRINKD